MRCVRTSVWAALWAALPSTLWLDLTVMLAVTLAVTLLAVGLFQWDMPEQAYSGKRPSA